MNRRLLILSCSQKKRSEAALMPAIERYDGPSFRVLRKFLRESSQPLLDVYILSAEFGLIPSNKLISHYDRKMTVQRAIELRPNVNTELASIFERFLYNHLFINLGQTYLQALNGYQVYIPPQTEIRIASGTLGGKQAQLQKWLQAHSPPSDDPRVIPVTGSARIKGIEVIMLPEQVKEIARQALKERKGQPANYNSWYVLIDDQKVSPKWLVSLLTGLSVSDFHTDNAKRVLRQLGIEVHTSI